jgi:hypothetical protein
MEHINFSWEYPPSGNSVLQVGVSTQYSSPGSIRSDGIYKLPLGVSTQREQCTSGGSIHPVLLIWEYPFRWNI